MECMKKTLEVPRNIWNKFASLHLLFDEDPMEGLIHALEETIQAYKEDISSEPPYGPPRFHDSRKLAHKG